MINCNSPDEEVAEESLTSLIPSSKNRGPGTNGRHSFSLTRKNTVMMNKQLLSKINRALERTKTTSLAPVSIENLQVRLTEELDWLDADEARGAWLLLMSELAAKMRGSGIVLSPGYGYLTSSFLLFLAGVTEVNPVEWNLPFSRFIRSFRPSNDIVLETAIGGHEVARKFLQNRDELIVETEPGTFQITFLVGGYTDHFQLHILEYAELDRFERTVRKGWRPLDELVLRLFRRADTDGTIWFESDKIREWLFEFEPESMSDIVLLRALFHPDGMKLYPEILRCRQNPDAIPSTGNAYADYILRDSYGILVYQEQALMLEPFGCQVEIPAVIDESGPATPFNKLRVKGHEIARTMLSVEAVALRKNNTSLK